MRSDRKLPLIECFGPTIQGEGVMAGRWSHFIRLGGCPRKCVWCDSMHAVDAEQVKANAEMLTPGEIAGRILQLPSSPWVTLSGGDPLMWDLSLLVQLLHQSGYKVAVETQGDLDRSWTMEVDCLTISPKPPSAGPQDGPPNYDVIDQYVLNPITVLKVVVFDEEDLNFAEEVHRRYPKVQFYISTGTDHPKPEHWSEDDLRLNIAMRYAMICDLVLERPSLQDVAIFPQLHVICWGSKLGV